MELIIMIELVS